jgi:transposase
MKESKRKKFSAQMKGKVALEAVQGLKTVNELAQAHGVHPTQVGQWKKELQAQVGRLFEGKRGIKPLDERRDPEKLYTEIGRLKVELDWLKKKSGCEPWENGEAG